jgi:hypothetical protein
VAGDVRRLTDLRPARIAKELADAVEWRSVAMPMTALAMILPLTLQLAFVSAVRVAPPDRATFDAWIGLSLLCVGHCHVVLAAQVWRFADRVRATDDAFTVGLVADRAGWRAWGLSIAFSVVAGLLLLLALPLCDVALPAILLPLAVSALAVIAPALVAVTGLAFIPAMFGLMGRCLREERLLLAYPAYCRSA